MHTYYYCLLTNAPIYIYIYKQVTIQEVHQLNITFSLSLTIILFEFCSKEKNIIVASKLFQQGN